MRMRLREGKKTFFEAFLESYGDDPEYLAERLVLQVNAEIRRRMDDLGISRSELARRLGVKQPQVSRLLNRDQNLTLRSLALVANALEAEWAPAQLVRKRIRRFEKETFPLEV